jgi:hypothetical protein
MRTLPRKPTSTTRSPAPVPAPRAVRPSLDQPVAQALLAVWSGDRAVVVASPPGAGKTRLVALLARELISRAGRRVAIAAQTRAQAVELASRAALHGADIVLLDKARQPRPDSLHPRAGYSAGIAALPLTAHGVVTTTDRWLWTRTNGPRPDILIVDEAWQLSWAKFGALAALADQVVLVGDPGQIAPVITGDTSRWTGRASGPQQPAPDALLAAYPDSVTQLRLPRTWRLGPETTALIQPHFYPELPFTSARPPRHLHLSGAQQPELSCITVHPTGGLADPVITETAADRVRELLAQGSIADEHQHSRPLHTEDVAVVVPHVSQSIALRAQLADLPGLLIGTANQLQGLERDACVVVHPAAGYSAPTGFACDLGRLCVALSRHRAHASVIIDGGTLAALDRAVAAAGAAPEPALLTQRDVLTALGVL